MAGARLEAMRRQATTSRCTAKQSKHACRHTPYKENDELVKMKLSEGYKMMFTVIDK